MNKYQFSYIIGYRHSPDRLVNLLRVLDWLQPFSGVEIILVEQDSTPKLNFRDLKCKYFFTESNMPYNRSWAFNVGMKEATTNSIVFGDSDIIMEPKQLIDSINELQNFEAVNPYSKIIDLSPEEVKMNIFDIFKIDRSGRGDNDNQKINFSGGILCVRKDSMINIGAWDEKFISWGCEDNFVTDKIFRFLKHKQMNNKAYHLWHQPTIPDYTHYQNNLKLLNELLSLDTNTLLAYIRSTIPSIGFKSKYQNI